MPGASASSSQVGNKEVGLGGAGALLSSCVPLVFLGLASGVTCPCYLASLGFFQEKFGSDLLFGAQATVVVVAHFVAIGIQEWFDADVLPAVVPGSGFLLRLPVCSALACAALILTPVCSSQVAVLVNGAIISMLGTWLHGASSQLGAVEGGGLLVSAGFALGSLWAVLLAWVTSFGPGSSMATAYFYYSLAGATCLAGAPLWLWYRRSDAAQEEAAGSAAWPADVEPAEAQPLRLGNAGQQQPAYETLSGAGRARAGEDVGDEADGLCSSCRFPAPCTNNAVGIFLSLASGFLLVPLFPLCGPTLACAVYQMKCLGDCVGRLLAVRHASSCATRGGLSVAGTVRCAAMLLVFGRLMAAFIVLTWLLSSGLGPPDFRLALALVAGVYGAGGYGQFVLDLDAQLLASEQRRSSVARCHTLVMCLGMLLGLGAGVLLVLPRVRL
mmetsp:Transcript_46674/g.99654  ORF Transcript_46674/g.99654 Transcript_46674/m.99654 type:complete len:442 (-) Transcript_46674:89-1414(-)